MERLDRFLPLTHLTFHLLLELAEAPGHGYALVKRIQDRSGGLVDPGTGSFYTIVHGAVDAGLVADARDTADPRRRQFAITRLGREVLAAEARRLRSVAQRAERVLTRPARRTS